MSRLFIGHLIKYTCTPNEFKTLSNVYIVTTDVDLFPLSTKMYSDYSHDLAIINPLNIDAARNKLYVALSCIGGSLSVWDALADESEIAPLKYFNAEGIRKICYDEEQAILKEKPKTQKLSWYMDQILSSKLIRRYLDKYGWDRYRARTKGDPTGRVDRAHISNNLYNQVLDENRNEPFKDSHICRGAYTNGCWWNLYKLMKISTTEKDLKKLAEYRNSFIQLMLNSTEIGSNSDRRHVMDEAILRKKLLKYFDIRNEWTQVYPQKYVNNYKPKWIDWENERLFRTYDWIRNYTVYYVIPNKHEIIDDTSLFSNKPNTPGLFCEEHDRDGSFHVHISRKNCTEIIFRK